MTLQIDGFSREALEAYSSSAGRPAQDMTRMATLYYLADHGLDRPAWDVPRFLRAPDRSRGEALEVECDEEPFDTLDREARRQGVAAERLVEHALIYFLADCDAGRLAYRLTAAMGEEA